MYVLMYLCLPPSSLISSTELKAHEISVTCPVLLQVLTGALTSQQSSHHLSLACKLHNSVKPIIGV